MPKVKAITIPAKILKTDITSTQMTFALRDILWYTDSSGNAVSLAVADFGTNAKGYGVWEPRTEREEWFEWDTSTLLSFATGITVNLRGLTRTAPYVTEDASRKFAHPSGSKVLLFTNAPQFYNEFAAKANDETVTGEWTFPTGADNPKVGTVYAAPIADTDIATKKYADDLAIAGSPDATTAVKGIVEIATGAECAAGTATGSTGATLAVPASNCKNSSAGAGDANKLPVLDAGGKLAASFGGSASGLATLNASSKVVEDPANAQSTSGVAKIPVGKAVTGKIDESWLQTTDANMTDLTDGGTTVLHNHAKSSVSATRDLAAASGAVNYAHGLGSVPKYVRITAIRASACLSHGTYDGTTNRYVSIEAGAGAVSGGDGSIVILNAGGGATQIAVATFDATNVTLTWTKNGSPTGTAYLLIESFS